MKMLARLILGNLAGCNLLKQYSQLEGRCVVLRARKPVSFPIELCKRQWISGGRTAGGAAGICEDDVAVRSPEAERRDAGCIHLLVRGPGTTLSHWKERRFLEV